jgi:hypothetical protein
MLGEQSWTDILDAAEVYKGHTIEENYPIVVKLFLKDTEYLFKIEIAAYNALRGIPAVNRLLWAGHQHGYPALAFPMLSADLWHYGVKLRHLLTPKILCDVAIRAVSRHPVISRVANETERHL